MATDYINTVSGASSNKLNTVTNMISNTLEGDHKKKQAISAHEWAMCQLTVCFEFLSRNEKDTKVVPCKWHSELKY